MRFYANVQPPAFIPQAAIEKALQAAMLEGAQEVLAEGNRMMESSGGGRVYGQHVAAALNMAPAVLTKTLVNSGEAVIAKETKAHTVGALAQWTAPHAHLMADGFMHKPHRPKTAFVPGHHAKKKWDAGETPQGSVWIPPHPFARPAGLALLSRCADLVKKAIDGLKP